MSNQVNLNGILISDADLLAKDQTVPQNTSADGNGGSFDIGKTQASIEVIAKVGSVAIGLANGTALTVKLQQSSDNAVADAFTDLATLYTKTASGAEEVAAGTELGRFILPSNAERYIKAVLTSTDAAGTGKVDVFLTYVPR